MHPPCKDCDRRTVNCHDTCKEYRQFRAEREAICKERYRQRKSDPRLPTRDKRGRTRK